MLRRNIQVPFINGAIGHRVNFEPEEIIPMRPKTAFLTILLAAVLATTVIGIGTRATQANADADKPTMRSL
jgi:hypothetical protein